MVEFIGNHRGEHGVEPICKVLSIASSTYYDRLAVRADPARLSARARRAAALRPEIERVFEENWRVYGVRKVWRQLDREGVAIDAYAWRIVGWQVSASVHAGFVLDALEQAVYDRRPVKGAGLVHHSDRGSQYLSIRYTERLAEAGIEPSVGSVGDSYDNALAETIKGLFKAEVIHCGGPWRSFDTVEYAVLEWVDWFNNRRLLQPIGNIPPAEAEGIFYAALETEDIAT